MCLCFQHAVADNFRLLWKVFEPILFGLIGTEIDISVLDQKVVGFAVLSLAIAMLVSPSPSTSAVCTI